LAQEYDVPQNFFVKKDSRKPGFHIEYEVKESPLGGVGLFAKERIPCDTLIWKFAPELNVRTFKDEVAVRSHFESIETEQSKYDWISHVYCFDGHVNEILDDGKYWYVTL
jgi:hypothetical protein